MKQVAEDGQMDEAGSKILPGVPHSIQLYVMIPASVLPTLLCALHLATSQTCSPARAGGVELRKVQVEKGWRLQLAPGGGAETS